MIPQKEQNQSKLYNSLAWIFSIVKQAGIGEDTTLPGSGAPIHDLFL